MTKTRSKFPFFILIITLISACFGAVALQPATVGTYAPSAALGAQETFQGLRTVMQGGVGTLIMEKGNLLLMAWPRGGEYAFAILGKDGAGVDFNSLKVNTLNLTMMCRSLKEGGWTQILPEAVPAAIAQALGMLSVEMAMTATRALPTIFIVPLWIIEPTQQEIQ